MFAGYEPVPGDDDKRADWPAAEACPAEPNQDRLRLTLPPRCRQNRTEPPGRSRIERIAGTAEGSVRAVVHGAARRLEELITASDPDDDAGGGFLRELKAGPGQPVTRVSAGCSMGTSAGHGPGRVNAGQAGLLFSAKPPPITCAGSWSPNSRAGRGSAAP